MSEIHKSLSSRSLIPLGMFNHLLERTLVFHSCKIRLALNTSAPGSADYTKSARLSLVSSSCLSCTVCTYLKFRRR